MTTRTVTSLTVAAEASEALALATVRPDEAERLAEDAERTARREHDWASVSVARRAAGVAAMQLRQVDAAVVRLRGAVEAATKARRQELAREAYMSLASAYILRGAPRQAFASIELALAGLHGLAAARARVQRSAILQELGHVEQALADLRVALPTLRRTGDAQWEVRALSNRSLLLVTRRLFAAAESDLRRAQRLCELHQFTLPGAYVEHNLGCVYADRGDVPAALQHFDQAADRYAKLGLEVGSLMVDRAKVLLSVRLIAEAREAAQAAVNIYAAQHRRVHLPEAQLMLSTAALLDGDPDSALAAARGAAHGFTRLGRGEWRVLARYACLQAQAAKLAPSAPDAGPPTDARRRGLLAARLRACADQLDHAGWAVPSLDARILASAMALANGRREVAQQQLGLAARARRSGPAEVRARAWLAEAMLRADEGSRHGAKTALRAGLRVIDEYRETLGATELRAHVSVHRGALAAAGLRMALQDHDARAVHWWSECNRASANRVRPARPPDDPGLVHDLQDLRATMGEIEAARTSGMPTSRLLARQIHLERRIRDHSRRLPNVDAQTSMPQSVEELTTDLGETALVEYVEVDDQLHAVTVVDGHPRLHTLGSSSAVRHWVTHVPFALRRLAHPRTRGPQVPAAQSVVVTATSVLQDVLLAPLSNELGDRPLLIVSAGWLQSVPWSAVPSCRGRPVTVAPSAGLWRVATDRPVKSGAGVVAVAGPGLTGATAEARAVAALHPGATVLAGSDANAAAVAKALNGAMVAHIAAHGSLRSDNPLFSALLLYDGPFTVYDLESLDATPRHVVIAACNTALSQVTAGQEILGLAAALLNQQTSTLVAPVVTIPDAETVEIMATYHRNLRSGRTAAQALAAAQEEHRHDSIRAGASAAAFVCLGSGDQTLRPPA